MDRVDREHLTGRIIISLLVLKTDDYVLNNVQDVPDMNSSISVSWSRVEKKVGIDTITL